VTVFEEQKKAAAKVRKTIDDAAPSVEKVVSMMKDSHVAVASMAAFVSHTKTQFMLSRSKARMLYREALKVNAAEAKAKTAVKTETKPLKTVAQVEDQQSESLVPIAGEDPPIVISMAVFVEWTKIEFQMNREKARTLYREMKDTVQTMSSFIVVVKTETGLSREPARRMYRKLRNG